MNVQSQQENPSQTLVKKNYYPIILGSLIFLIAIVAGAYYLGTKQSKPEQSSLTQSSDVTASAASQSILTPTTIVTPDLTQKYKTRHYNMTDNFGENNKYPAELLQVEESSLTPIACSPLYSGYGKGYTFYDEKTQKSYPLSDASLLSYIETINKKYESQFVSEIITCSAEQGKTVVLYSIGPCGGGCSGIPHVGVVNNADIIEVANIPAKFEENMAYFGCRQPLQLTKDNMFYFRCGGGDGPGSSASLYKLSLDNFSLSRVKQCTSGVDGLGKPFSTCN